MTTSQLKHDLMVSTSALVRPVRELHLRKQPASPGKWFSYGGGNAVRFYGADRRLISEHRYGHGEVMAPAGAHYGQVIYIVPNSAHDPSTVTRAHLAATVKSSR